MLEVVKMGRLDIVMDDERLERFFRRLALIDQRGVARLGVRCHVATEPGSCPTAELRAVRLSSPVHGLAGRGREARPTPVEIPALPGLTRAREAAARGRTARLIARLTGTVRPAPAAAPQSFPAMSPLMEWARPCPALKKP